MPPPAVLRSLRPCGCSPAPPPARDRREGRDGRGRLRQKGTRHDRNDTLPLPRHDTTPNSTPPRRPRICSTSSRSTAIAPARTNPIRGRCPSRRRRAATLAASSTPSAPCSTDTRLEDDLDDLLWSFVNLFHRETDRVERELDSNEQAQRRGQREQDGSEVNRSSSNACRPGHHLIERRNAFEFCATRPPNSSRPHRHRLAAARRIDGQPPRPHRRDDRQPRIPRRPPPRRHRGAGSGRPAHRLHRRHECNDHSASGTRSTRSAPSIPTWCCCTAAARAAPNASPPAGPTTARSRRSPSSPTGPATQRRPLQAQRPAARGLPIGVVVFPGSGISANLADKAKKLGIPVWRFTSRLHPARAALSAASLSCHLAH